MGLGLVLADTPLTAATRRAPAAWRHRAWLRSIQPKIAAGPVSRNLARSLGLAPPLRRVAGPGGLRSALADTTVGTDALGNENTPSIAASPVNERLVVAVMHNDASGTLQCSAYASYDGGVTFGWSFDLPLQANPGEYCSDPVVRTTPVSGGLTAYFVFSYLSVRADSSSSDVMTVVADAVADPSTTIAGPTVVVPGGGSALVDAPWIGAHTFDDADGSADGANFVYLTATLFTPPPDTGDCSIVFSRSTDYGVTWSSPATLALSPGCSSVLQGARPAGAPGQQVLVCYFDSGADGFNVDDVSGGKFNIACRSSKDRGVAFSPTPIVAAKDVVYELPRALPGGTDPLAGPIAYHDIWRSMFPSLEIDQTGTVHLVFAADPTPSKTDAECANVYYVKSSYPNGSTVTAPAYDKWTARIAVGTGPKAQVFPTVVSQRTNTQVKPFVYVAYADHARGDLTKPNRVYDVKYRMSSVGGTTFGAPVLVTTQSSLADSYYIGDYFDSAATMRRYHLIWTDRADKTDVADPECDVFTRWY
jgi:hypothetical protein